MKMNLEKREIAMSYRYISGRQVPLRRLILFFFIANVIYFGASTASDLYAQVNNMPYSSIAKEMVGKRIHQKRFEAAYETRSWIVSKALLVLTVFYFSFAFYFVNYRKGLGYIDHLAVSFEFMAYATVTLTILSWIPSLIVSLIAVALLLYAFERNAYKQQVFRSMTNAALLVFCFYAVMLMYRASVFFLTMLTL